MNETEQNQNQDSIKQMSLRVTVNGLDIGAEATKAVATNLSISGLSIPKLTLAQNATRSINLTRGLGEHIKLQALTSQSAEFDKLLAQNTKILELTTNKMASWPGLSSEILSLGKWFEDYNKSLASSLAPFRAWNVEMSKTLAPVISIMEDLKRQLSWIASWDERTGPSNWPKGRQARMKLERLAKLRSLAMFGFPSEEIVSDIVALEKVQQINSYLTANASRIGTDIEKTLSGKKYPKRLKKPLAEVARSLTAGNLMAAQSLALNIVEDVRSEFQIRKVGDFQEGIRDIQIDLVPNSHYGWGYVMEVLKDVMRTSKPWMNSREPRNLSRASSAHKVDGHQYTPKNAVRAALLAFSMVEVRNHTPANLKAILDAASDDQSPYQAEFLKTKARRDRAQAKKRITAKQKNGL